MCPCQKLWLWLRARQLKQRRCSYKPQQIGYIYFDSSPLTCSSVLETRSSKASKLDIEWSVFPIMMFFLGSVEWNDITIVVPILFSRFVTMEGLMERLERAVTRLEQMSVTMQTSSGMANGSCLNGIDGGESILRNCWTQRFWGGSRAKQLLNQKDRHRANK